MHIRTIIHKNDELFLCIIVFLNEKEKKQTYLLVYLQKLNKQCKKSNFLKLIRNYQK